MTQADDTKPKGAGATNTMCIPKGPSQVWPLRSDCFKEYTVIALIMTKMTDKWRMKEKAANSIIYYPCVAVYWSASVLPVNVSQDQISYEELPWKCHNSTCLCKLIVVALQYGQSGWSRAARSKTWTCYSNMVAKSKLIRATSGRPRPNNCVNLRTLGGKSRLKKELGLPWRAGPGLPGRRTRRGSRRRRPSRPACCAGVWPARWARRRWNPPRGSAGRAPRPGSAARRPPRPLLCASSGVGKVRGARRKLVASWSKWLWRCRANCRRLFDHKINLLAIRRSLRDP